MTRTELNQEIRHLSEEIETVELRLRSLPAVRFDLVKRHGQLLRALAEMPKEN
jgi:hypothetical protein